MLRQIMYGVNKKLMKFMLVLSSSPKCPATIKSDRINALRQKYEHYLEEDRKRKERNEYILGKLDRMRHSSASIHAYKLNANTEAMQSPTPFHHPITPRLPHLDCTTSQQRRSLHTGPQKHIIATTSQCLLQDIMNKFILIPKRAEMAKLASREYDKNDADRSDWTSKYDILKEIENVDKIEKLASNIIDRQPNDINENIPRYHDLRPNVAEKEMSGNKKEECQSVPPNDHIYPTYNAEEFEIGDEIGIAHDFNTKDPKVDLEVKFEDSTDFPEVFQNKTEIYTTYPNENLIRRKQESNEIMELEDNDGVNPAVISYDQQEVGKPFDDFPKQTEDMQFSIEVINIDELTPNLNDTAKVNTQDVKSKTIYNQPLTDDLETTYTICSADPRSSETGAKTHTTPETNVNLEADMARIPKLFADAVDNDDKQGKQVYEIPQVNPDPSIYETRSPLDQTEEDVFTPLKDYPQENQYYYEAPHEQQEYLNVGDNEETNMPYDPSYEQQYMSKDEQQYSPEPQQQQPAQQQESSQQQFAQQDPREQYYEQYTQQQTSEENLDESPNPPTTQYTQDYFDQQQYSPEVIHQLNSVLATPNQPPTTPIPTLNPTTPQGGNWQEYFEPLDSSGGVIQAKGPVIFTPESIINQSKPQTPVQSNAGQPVVFNAQQIEQKVWDQVFRDQQKEFGDPPQKQN